MTTNPHKDEISGVDTTGHEWDGIKELNNPLPRWWLYVFYASIVISIVYWILMPAWPYPTWDGWDYTRGTRDYSERDTVTAEIAKAQAELSVYLDQMALMSTAEIRQDETLYNVALAGGGAAFGDSCAGCHGSGAQGFIGFPNLNDDEWIWGGSLDDIEITIRHGIRWEDDDDSRYSEMPKFLADGILSREEIGAVTDYVMILSQDPAAPSEAPEGAEIFARECASCHGEAGKGMQDLGAPNLTNAISLYGQDRKALYDTIANSRFGVMPAWQDRMSDVTIKQLTLYVHGLGGGQE